jgi:apolipoprotein D and lipocalin family protein
MIAPVLARAGGLGAFVGSALGIPAIKHDELQTAESVDLSKYAGLWYEIARLPTSHEDKCATDVTALYVLDEDGFAVTNRCLREDGTEVEAAGRARRVPGATSSKLEVTFAPTYLRFLPFVWADYWVLHVDEGYQTAVVGTVDRDHLWFLSRSPSPTDEQLDSMIAIASERGFDVSRLKSTPQRG